MTEAQGMVTKIAAAIAEVHLHGPEDPVFDFYALTEEVADEYYEMAIKAMRDPTDVYRAFVDAALNEQEKG